MKQPTFGIYIPSYKRAKSCTAHRFLQYGTYIVRASEEAEYREALRDVEDHIKVWAVEDELICGLTEVNQWLIDNAPEHRMPLVLATTGYDQGQLEEIQQAARSIPIFRSANLSLGVNVLVELVRRTAAVLGGSCDIEIMERHHNKKMDAPSGTALMLAEAAADALPCQPELVCGRQGIRRSRERCEIGISSVRGGGIVGDHEVLFAGRDELIELRHSALSREVFASGAVQAARFLAAGQSPGLYSMADLVTYLGL